MNRLLSLSIALLLLSTLTWAQNPTVVTTDEELRAAVTADNANIQVGNDITLPMHIPIAANVTIDLNGYTLSGNAAPVVGENDYKCLFIVAENGSLTLSNGILAHTDNRDASHHNPHSGSANSAGGIVNNGTATLQDITITDCKGMQGGGIYNKGTLTLTDVTITDCEGEFGGAFFNYEDATANIIRGSFTNNSCEKMGGGIVSMSALRMQGAITVQDNRSRQYGYINNMYLIDSLITVTGSLAGSRIYITGTAEGSVTQGYTTYNSGIDPATLFYADLDPYMQIVLSANEASLAKQDANAVYYINRTWDDTKQEVISELAVLDSYTELSGGNDAVLGNEWYVVKGNVTYNSISFDRNSSAQHLILCDGARLTTKHVKVDNYGILHIYGQQADEGSLTTSGKTDYQAGIGSYKDGFCSGIHIHGGTIHATGGYLSAGIGASAGEEDFTDFGVISIYGGFITAQGGEGAAGIGFGHNAPNESGSREINIYGGHIVSNGGNNGAGIGGGNNAPGPNTTIYGGDIQAVGYDGAGIGGGDSRNGGTIVINGGKVIADGYGDGTSNGAGIGGGVEGNGGSITINGGEIIALGGAKGAGIGGGEDAAGGAIVINGGTIIARSGYEGTGNRAIGPGNGSDNYGTLALGDDLMVSSERKALAGERVAMCWYRTHVTIEPCDHSDEWTYTVDGTTATDHHISHCPYCNHSEMDNHHFNGQGQCTVCGVQGETKTVKLWMPKKQNDDSFDGNTYEPVSSHLIVPNTNYVLQLATLTVPNLEFLGWEATTAPTGDSYTSPYTTATADTLYRAGNRYTITDNISFVARYKAGAPTAIEETPYPARTNDSYKYLRDGILFIEKNGKTYNIQGALLK